MNQWIKACADSSCIEIMNSDNGTIGIRVNNELNGFPPTILATREEWEAFKQGVKDGKFDSI